MEYIVYKHLSNGVRIPCEVGKSLDLITGAMEYRYNTTIPGAIVKFSVEDTEGNVYSELEV